jgi:protein-disulfide isomerase
MIALLVLHAMLTQELDAHPEAPDRPAGPGIDLPLVAGLPLVLGIALAVMNSQMSVPPAINLPKEVLANVEFVPEGANTYGQPDSPLTIVEFADILCPACQNTSPLVKDFVTENSGKVRLVYRHFPLDKIHPQAMAAAAISEVAADQGKFWDFTLAVMSYGKQPESPDELLQLASQVGLDSDMVRARLQNSEDKAYADVANDLKTVKELGIISTPTFFLLSDGKVIGKPLGPRDIMPRLQEAEIQAIMNGKKS